MSSTCLHQGGPPMNTDVSGLGVRISFYLQTLFLACLAIRSGSLDEITGALYTLVATNVAMAVTALILGSKTLPEISFHDGLVVFYLLSMSWFTVIFTIPTLHRFDHNVKFLKLWSIAQSYVVFVFAFILIVRAEDYGSNPECNPHAVVVLFRPFSALRGGRILGWIVTVSVVSVYSVMTGLDYFPPQPKKKVQDWITKKRNRKMMNFGQEAVQELPRVDPIPNIPQNPEPIPEITTQIKIRPLVPVRTGYDLQIGWDLVTELILVLILWSLAVMNTELLISWNHFDQSDDIQSPWQFGQVLPMFLIVLPLVNMVNSFHEFKLRPWQLKKGKCANCTSKDKLGPRGMQRR